MSSKHRQAEALQALEICSGNLSDDVMDGAQQRFLLRRECNSWGHANCNVKLHIDPWKRHIGIWFGHMYILISLY